MIWVILILLWLAFKWCLIIALAVVVVTAILVVVKGVVGR